MDVIIAPLIHLLIYLTTLYTYAIFAAVILNMLTLFGVINPHNSFVLLVSDFLFRLTEPALHKIRQCLPPIGAMDLSPMALILLLWFIRSVLEGLLSKYF